MQRALRILGAMHSSACASAAAYPSSVLQVLWLGGRLELFGADCGGLLLLLLLLLHLQRVYKCRQTTSLGMPSRESDSLTEFKLWL
jgi:hypothetical protein